MSSFTAKLKQHYSKSTFSISEFLGSMGIKNRDVAENVFKATIAGIISNKRNQKDIRKWAQLLADTEYSILATEEAEQYWQRVAASPEGDFTFPSSSTPSQLPRKRNFTSSTASSTTSRRSERIVHNQRVVYDDESDNEEPAAKKKRHDWFVGPGETESRIVDTCAQWDHHDADISARLRSHCDHVVAKALKEDLSDNADLLCLNFIFYFPRNKSDGIWHIFNEELKNQLSEELKHDEYQFMPNEALFLCHSLNKDINQEQGPTDTILKLRVEHCNNSLLQGFARVLEQVHGNLNRPPCDGMNEAMFITNSMLPCIKEIFPGTEGYAVIKPTTSAKAGAEDIKQFGSSLVADKPDICESKNNIGHLACEAKMPNRKCVGVYNDKVKLANELKYMLDHALNNDENPEQLLATTGILVEGYNCTTFVLELKYDGVYCLMEVDHFRMMETVEGFLPMIRMYESLLYLKHATTKKGSVENRKKWRRTSFQRPMKL